MLANLYLASESLTAFSWINTAFSFGKDQEENGNEIRQFPLKIQFHLSKLFLFQYKRKITDFHPESVRFVEQKLKILSLTGFDSASKKQTHFPSFQRTFMPFSFIIGLWFD